MKIITTLLFLISSISHDVICQKAITAESILEKYIEAIGGSEVILDIKTIRTTGRLTIDGIEHKLIEQVKQPYYYSLERHYANKKMKAIMAIDKGVNITEEGIFRMPPDQIQRNSESLSVVPEILYLSDTYQLKYNGIYTLYGQIKCHEIEITKPDGSKVWNEYNAENGLLELSQYNNQKTRYLEYKEFNGILYPIKFSKNGLLTKIEEVLINQEIAKSEFEWNTDIDNELIGRWEAKKEKKDTNNQIEVSYIELNDDRGGTEGIGILENDTVDEVPFLKFHIVGWELQDTGIKMHYYDAASKKLWSRILIIEKRTTDRITGYVSDPELEKSLTSKTKPIILEFEKVNK